MRTSAIFQATLGLVLLFALACGPSDPLSDVRALHSAGQYAESIGPLRRIVDEDPSAIVATLIVAGEQSWRFPTFLMWSEDKWWIA